MKLKNINLKEADPFELTDFTTSLLNVAVASALRDYRGHHQYNLWADKIVKPYQKEISEKLESWIWENVKFESNKSFVFVVHRDWYTFSDIQVNREINEYYLKTEFLIPAMISLDILGSFNLENISYLFLPIHRTNLILMVISE